MIERTLNEPFEHLAHTKYQSAHVRVHSPVQERRTCMAKSNLTLHRLAALANFRRGRGRANAQCLRPTVIATSTRTRTREHATPADCVSTTCPTEAKPLHCTEERVLARYFVDR